ncbi:leucine-rich repeat-containing protein 15 [Triplophysa rosa]|uniref:Insulin-like growth factor-binding protein complex acid labile subunit n=1 Tax=Triplophysa rosa TaxID=992332 RepID=A0A9W7T5N7_TRIRA|nr:leucine-rich repeat-containing protein 15 [Triplophysa rosa]KAI7790979.1 putative insulin-like growth factor-binding protein complex acid labile subunit [Triplophysa rosa]
MHLLLVLPFVLEVQSTVHNISCDCNVELKTANCTGRNFKHLPASLPPSTEQLDLSHNHLSDITPRFFQTARKLSVLLLKDNEIRVLANGAFFLLEDLLKLDLSRNRISSLSEGFSLGLGSLRELSLAENKLTVLDSNGFVHLDSLQKLNLSHNGIKTIKMRAFGSTSTLRQIQLDWNNITVLTNGIFSMLRNLEVLNLRHNQIHSLDVGALSPLTSLALLDLTNNNLSSIQFKTFLSLNTYSTHILLRGNPWKCDCDLQRVFRKLCNVKRLFLDDYDDLSCSDLDEIHGYSMGFDTELCVAEMVTVLVITLTVFITVVAALVMAEKKRKKKIQEKHWTEVNEMSCTSQD